MKNLIYTALLLFGTSTLFAQANFGTLKGKIVETDIHLMMRKKLKHTGSTLRSQSIKFKSEITKKLEKKIWPLLEKNQIKPVVYQTFPLEEAELAHKLMTSGKHFGKIILTV